MRKVFKLLVHSEKYEPINQSVSNPLHGLAVAGLCRFR
jgi:hypothetical protein